MPRTIDEGFRDFLPRLTPSDYESDAAKRHRASIEQCIKSNLGLQRFWRTGSFGNGTSIYGRSDVDYMADIPEENLSRNSFLSLRKLRSVLVRRFPNTGVRTACPAVIVPFGTDARETTEVTPAFYVGTQHKFKVYGIPDCAGGWIKASPDAHNFYVRSVDRSLSLKVKPLVRFIKAWKYFNNVPVSSFYLELRVAKYASKQNSILYSADVAGIFRFLHDSKLAKVRDPMGISGNISPCRTNPHLRVTRSKIATARTRALKACEAEMRGNTREAFDWWNKLFARKFPGYYR